MVTKKFLIIFIAFTLFACAGVTQPIKFEKSNVVSKESYLKNKATNGVVLLDVNWGRWWGCGGHENAHFLILLA